MSTTCNYYGQKPNLPYLKVSIVDLHVLQAGIPDPQIHTCSTPMAVTSACYAHDTTGSNEVQLRVATGELLPFFAKNLASISGFTHLVA